MGISALSRSRATRLIWRGKSMGAIEGPDKALLQASRPVQEHTSRKAKRRLAGAAAEGAVVILQKAVVGTSVIGRRARYKGRFTIREAFLRLDSAAAVVS